jgi:hypothetical protein
LEDPLAPKRVTTMLPDAVVMMVGAPSPILKETPTGLWSMSTCGAKKNCLVPKFELLEEGYHLLLHGSLDVNHVVNRLLALSVATVS